MVKGGRVTGAVGACVGERRDASRVGPRAGSMGGCGR